MELIPIEDNTKFAPVIYAHWEKKNECHSRYSHYGFICCSNCGWGIPCRRMSQADYKWHYCPNCGAKMSDEELCP